MFATDTSGTVVWTASYLPFGGIRMSSGLPLDPRFPASGSSQKRPINQ